MIEARVCGGDGGVFLVPPESPPATNGSDLTSCPPANSLPYSFVAPQIPLLPQPLPPGLMGRGGGKVPWQSRACLFLVNEDHN